MLEVFDCKFTCVPRPDIVVTEIGVDLSGWALAPSSQVPPHPIAIQESRDLQRKVLKQLGRLTRLRTFSLQTVGYNNEWTIYSQLEISGIQTMIVEGAVQTDCLDLTLERGPDELAGLKELEQFAVYQMAHRIGIPEVKWMVDNWPKLKNIHGRRYKHCDAELRFHNEDEEGNSDGEDGEEEEPETIVWMRASRPDIIVS
ncbi:hypothetical protein BG015_000709 [Linnemannia schmuckeri]|uniref:Uncharacterized protein n=1 Tax=Linnemannia schmuckeri TaxID=64567 RepID=A0A9P5V7E4_9FUNG|nr:hypothetical protein BG015_000709 [Linnemannia schmuckeri]